MAAARSKPEKLGEVERVYRLVREWLIAGALKPGEFLAEGDLATRCRTSRTPVREACTRLMQDKWLSRIPHKGFLVTPISVRDMVDLYEYRKLLEGFAAEHVAQAAGAEQIDELKAILAPESRKQAKLAEVLSANERFHLRLAELAGNQRVWDQLRLSLAYVSRLDRLCTQTVPGWIGHAEILAAIEARKPTQARLAMARHIDASRDKMIRLFGT